MWLNSKCIMLKLHLHNLNPPARRFQQHRWQRVSILSYMSTSKILCDSPDLNNHLRTLWHDHLVQYSVWICAKRLSFSETARSNSYQTSVQQNFGKQNRGNRQRMIKVNGHNECKVQIGQGIDYTHHKISECFDN